MALQRRSPRAGVFVGWASSRGRQQRRNAVSFAAFTPFQSRLATLRRNVGPATLLRSVANRQFLLTNAIAVVIYPFHPEPCHPPCDPDDCHLRTRPSHVFQAIPHGDGSRRTAAAGAEPAGRLCVDSLGRTAAR